MILVVLIFFIYFSTKYDKIQVLLFYVAGLSPRSGNLFGMVGWFECTYVHFHLDTQGSDYVEDGEIHDRMPVILRPEDEAIWMDRKKQDVKLLQSLLVPYPAEEMRAYPVSPLVGNVKNDSVECILERLNKCIINRGEEKENQPE
ncbi:SOS response-associated peptidase family protein [Collibacillus ludicampi]|uniref:SOS response-associated peptidase family protein n=1 Tax=Collibacillus ludicampi TaxID=2771369 RepID=UPI0034E2AA7F